MSKELSSDAAAVADDGATKDAMDESCASPTFSAAARTVANRQAAEELLDDSEAVAASPTAAANSVAEATAASPSQANDGEGGDVNGDEGGDGAAEEEEEDASLLSGITPNEVKNIVLQVLSPYFDDDAGSGVPGVDPAAAQRRGSRDGGGSLRGEPDVHDEEREDTAQRYDHEKSQEWITLICDGIMERLIGLGKTYKFVVHCLVMRKCGAGMHVCSSCYYAASDGWLSHAHDLSAHIYAVVTVYWSII